MNHQGPLVDRPMGFWHLKISSVQVPTLICTCVRIPSISYARKFILHVRMTPRSEHHCQNPSVGWQKYVRIPWVAQGGGGLVIYTDWCIATKYDRLWWCLGQCDNTTDRCYTSAHIHPATQNAFTTLHLCLSCHGISSLTASNPVSTGLIVLWYTLPLIVVHLTGHLKSYISLSVCNCNLTNTHNNQDDSTKKGRINFIFAKYVQFGLYNLSLIIPAFKRFLPKLKDRRMFIATRKKSFLKNITLNTSSNIKIFCQTYPNSC